MTSGVEEHSDRRGGSAICHEPALVTVWDLISERALIHPDHVAIEERNAAWTYGELVDRAGRLAEVFLAKGLRRGDRIAVLSDNRHEYVELIVAAARIGVAVACLNWRFAADELKMSIELADPTMVFVAEKFSDLAQTSIRTEMSLVAFGAQYEKFLAADSSRGTATKVDPEDILTLLYTSGTTGRAKAAMISQRALIARAALMIADGILIPGLAFVAWAPFFHIGANDTSVATLIYGGKVILVDGFEPESILSAVRHNKIGWLSLAGTVSRFVDELTRNPILTKQVSTVGSMADLVPRKDISAITALLQAPFLNSFASTETGLAPASKGRLPIGDLPEKFLKQQSSLCVIRLVDSEGNAVEDGTPGELIMRGPTLFSGYWRNAAATKEAFRDGWYHMGDIFIRHRAGLEFVGREKYLIKSGGENIYPAEIEQLVLASRRIQEAVLIGQPDAQWGEIPVLLVASNDPDLAIEDIAKLYEGKIARYKRPKKVIIVDQSVFPRTSTGKVKRNEIDVGLLISMP